MKDLVDLWLSQCGLCAISKVALIAGKTAELDHIIPVTKGGDSTIKNLRFIHISLNRMKQNMLDDEFQNILIALCPAAIEWAKKHLTA